MLCDICVCAKLPCEGSGSVVSENRKQGREAFSMAYLCRQETCFGWLCGIVRGMWCCEYARKQKKITVKMYIQ